MNELNDFLTHLLIERGLSPNSHEAYRRDLTSYKNHLDR
ncbi:MAG: site-specific integrase, partial [Gemmatimonadota bacterium]|nr:site-specific integrase [Gemmatimonadota bacterium]